MKFLSNKKGVIFSLDGAIAVSIVIIMLINTTYYFTTTSKESLSQTQIVKRGYDIITMFDEAGDLEVALRNVTNEDVFIPEGGINDGSYGLNISYYLPPGYDMVVELYDANKTPCPGSCNIDLSVEGDYYIQANLKTESLGSNPSLTIHGVGATTPIAGCSNCTYTTLKPVHVDSGNNLITVVGNDLGGYAVNWIRILDHPDYIMTTDPTIHEIPIDRFIGTGERWYAASDEKGHFEGFHKVRFKIWVV